MIALASNASKHFASHSALSWELVKGAAIGRWPAIAQSVFGIDPDYLTGHHGPCPKCGGNDRFRAYDDFSQTGGAICNQCGRDLGDGFKLGDWFCGWSRGETLKRVADYLGVQPAGRDKISKADPAEHLIWQPWSDSLVGLWCLNKPPITPAALRRCGARLAHHYNDNVIALPVWGKQLTAAKPVGWSLYNITGGTLPRLEKNDAGDWKVVEQLKIKLTFGSQPGLIGPVEELTGDDVTHIWKLEGPSDLLAFYSLADIAAGHVAVTNANGAGEKPPRWALELFAGKTVYTLHDADQPGELGASGWRDDKGKWHPGWATEAARYASESRQLALPYAVEKEHGKDLRDFLNGVQE